MLRWNNWASLLLSGGVVESTGAEALLASAMVSGADAALAAGMGATLASF